MIRILAEPPHFIYQSPHRWPNDSVGGGKSQIPERISSVRGSSLAIATAKTRTGHANLTQMLQAVAQVGLTKGYSKDDTSKPRSRVEIPVLLRAISAADWIAADFREDGNEELACYYERVANDLRRLAQSRGVTC